MDKLYYSPGKEFDNKFRYIKQLKSFVLLFLFTIGFMLSALAQSVVTGTVTDSKGEPLPGVSVKVKGAQTGATTDLNGKFTLRGATPSNVVVFSFIGFKSQEVAVGAKTVIDVKLTDNTTDLEEVVVVGYGTQKKATLTGAISSINSQEILKSPTANPTNSLIGKLPGLQAIQTSGQPGADAATLRIRGIATTGNSNAIVVVDGIERPGFGDIDPNEIETISILKDASSTAVYGIRGANGVIVITTKGGKIGTPRVSYTGNVSLQTYTGIPRGLDAYNNASLLNEAYVNDQKAAPFTDEELQKFKDGSDPYGYPDVQWFDYLTRKYYPQTQHNVNISGGTKIAKYFVSAGYLFQDGIFKKFDSPYGINTVPNYNRYNFRSNLDFNLSKDITFGIKLGGRFDKRYQPSGLRSSSAFSYDTMEGMISRILQTPSYAFPVTLPDGRIAQNADVGTNIWNPYAVLTRFGTRTDTRNAIESTFNINWKLDKVTRGLSFKTNFGYDAYYLNTARRNANWAAYRWDRRTGQISLSTDTRQRDEPLGAIVTNDYTPISGDINSNLQVGFNYEKSIKKHSLTALLLGTRQLLRTNTGADIFQSPPRAMQGLVNRITYNYADKYYFEFNASYNGSENFMKGRQYGFFPAGSFGWTLTNEPFMKKVEWLSYLKVRGSYGQVGSDNIGGRRFLFLTSYTNGGTNFGGPGNSVQFGSPQSPTNYPITWISPDNIGNELLTWERSTKRNIGLESRFFEGALKFNVDIFDEARKNILIEAKRGLLSFGHKYPLLNNGEVYNKGYEVELDYERKTGELTLGINGQLSFAKNVVRNFDEPEGTPDRLKVEGKPVNQFIGYVTDGFYTSIEDINNSVKPQGAVPGQSIIPGDLKFKDLDGDGVITSEDRQPIGYSSNPEYIYSFTPRASWKGVSLSVLFQGAAHVSSNLILNEQNNGQQMYPVQLERWTPETASTATWPALHSRGYTGLNYALNDFILQNSAYLKIRNVELAWTVPSRWTDRMKIRGIRIFANGQNLYTWTKFRMYVDPENLNTVNQAFPLQALYPSSRVYNLGLNINLQ
ncbi:SusC/RagA family TonB-linked outer membrane protein [Desertivirga arenae]|uniref:SusC/RagA family TonB-linked outer membrane protein n=1 Tax=Desertivirga arenae TaxID=2810309 RepID=UPI001A970753|nr:TonB-dependent receptor [Pedobacter sp. SYSU D00823]